MEFATNNDKHLAKIEKKTKSKVLTHAAEIINKHFSEAIHEKEAEIDAIEDSILEAQKALHLLRYGSVSQTYSNFREMSSNSIDSLHPAVKALVSGKCPKNYQTLENKNSRENKEELEISNKFELESITEDDDVISPLNNTKLTKSEQNVSTSDHASNSQLQDEATSISELPGYVGPSASNVEVDAAENARVPRGHQHKSKRRFVIGNVSKWIECNQREDSSTHKWMLYLRGCKTFPDVSDVVSKVRFFIHQTYAPNNVIDVTHPPYHLIRRGWGEFPARVQIHFKGAINKPVDIMHNIKLDKTYTGLQTLGAETLVDIWLHEVQREGSDEQGSVSTTPDSTRPSSPFEEITIPAIVESTPSSEVDTDDLSQNIELDVGEEDENIERLRPSTNCKSVLKENLEEEYSVPPKKSKVERCNVKPSTSNNLVGTRAAKVKPGTSLLLKRK